MRHRTWHRITDTAFFYEKSLPFLMRDEAIYNLPLGIAGRLKSNSKVYGDSYHLYLLTADQSIDSTVEGVVWWTPPAPMGFSYLTVDDVELFVRQISLTEKPQSLVGPPETLGFFTSRLGEPWKCFPQECDIQNQGIYSLSRLTDAFKHVDGEARLAIEDDFEIVLKWSDQFIIDCKSTRPANFETSVRDSIKNSTRALWILNSKPVSMAGTAGTTPNGARIAWVYTPQEMRNHGFGGAVTRFVSEQQFKSGKKFCFLYTDMANPTSNSIYKKLGCEYVGASQHAVLR